MFRFSTLCTLLLLVVVAATGCQRSYVVTYAVVIGRADEPNPEVVGSREDASTHLMILRSQRLWNDYITPKLPAGQSRDAIREGLTIRLVRAYPIDKEEVAEFQLTLGQGGAAEAEAVIGGYLDFLKKSGSPMVNSRVIERKHD